MELIGFEKYKKYFKEMVEDGQLSHAYIFTGPDMVGKKQFAFWLAETVNGRLPQNDPDIRVLAPRKTEDETQIYIEDIKDVRSFLSLKPTIGPYKIIFIDQADTLTPEAANSLLKSLEEPTSKTLLILVTSRIHDVLPTIRSRCLEIKFPAHPTEVIMDVASRYRLSEEDADLVCLLADGRLGWAIDCLENKKLPLYKKSVQDFQNVFRQGTAARILYAKKVIESGDYLELLPLWMRWVRAYGKNPEKTRTVLLRLQKLHVLFSQPQYNHKLALENFLINL